ncbi:MAG TPA: DUF2341 domain-containing protein, partial [Candidatus Thermoplasmatota archaeon]|nr:DUF2341 domain-containing protein [Candidatus Thermoplasmatota archaeon]
YYVRITNESLGLHKPEVLFQADIHGDEKVGAYGAYWFTDWLLRHAYHPDYQDAQSEWLRWLLDNREIYIVPSMNPDGFDENHRGDNAGNDMNRQYDHSQSNPWLSINTQTMRQFINNHVIRVAVDLHAGYRGIPYPWSNVNYRNDMSEQSAISGRTYIGQCPADFRFFDAAYLRLGTYIGNPSGAGAFTSSNIGPWTHTLGYDADGTSCDWWYGGNVLATPSEDPYVNDETFGNYPGCGIMATLVEYGPGNPTESQLGNDTNNKFGAEVRRTLLHQIDLAQPYLRWQGGTVENDAVVDVGDTVSLTWQVNGSLVVDNTLVQWGLNPDPVDYPQNYLSNHQDHEGDYYGGTGWDNAINGNTSGARYTETITLNAPGDYYFVAKAKVDQRYSSVIYPDEYGNTSYLRIIKERTDDSFYEQINGTDGIEIIDGQVWWYSPVIHVRAGPPVHQKIITVNHSKVLASLQNYPLFINLDSDTDLAFYAQDDGDDITFYDAAQNKLNHEIELFNGTTGQMIAWVNVPYLSSIEDTVLYMQYGNETSGNQQNPEGVWDSVYKGVWHLGEDFLDSTSNNNDATNYGSTDAAGAINDGQSFDGNDYITAPSHCLGADHNWTASCWFRSLNSTMLFHYFFSTGGYNAADAVNIWQNINQALDIGEVRSQIVDSTGDRIDQFNYGGTSYKDQSWHLASVTWDAPLHTLALYVDGSLENISTNSIVDTGAGTSTPLYIGARTDLEAQRFHIGGLDEVRIMNTRKNASWITTEYNNQHDPSQFYTIGIAAFEAPALFDENPSDESIDIGLNPMLSISVMDYQEDLMDIFFKSNSSGSWSTLGSIVDVGDGTYYQTTNDMSAFSTTYYWSVNCTDGTHWTNLTYRFTTEAAPPPWWNSSWEYRREITIHHTLVKGDLVNFPVLISIPTDSDLAEKAQNDADDLVITDYYGNRLNHEIELFNENTGQLVVWVNVTSLSKISDTNLFLYYGNLLCGNQQYPTAVWDSNYVAVWHLSEDPSVTGTGGIKDSTSYVNHGTDQGGMDSSDHISGMIGYGVDFDGTNDVIKIENSWTTGHSLDLTTGPMTLETWFKCHVESNQGTLISKRDGTTDDQYQFFVQPQLQFRANQEYGSGTDSLTTEIWYYGAVVVNSTNWPAIYRDGVMKTWADIAGSRPYDFVHRNVNVSIGARWQVYPTPGYPFNGVIDEVRISKIDRSSEWLNTCYNNQYNPFGFSALGTEESKSGVPSLSSETPLNNAVGQPLNPVLAVTVTDLQGDLMDILFRTNASGSWQTIGEYTSVGSGRYSQGSTNMNQYLTRYWWSLNVTDQGSHTWKNKTYVFSTKTNAPNIATPSPANGSIDVGGNPLLSISLVDYEGDLMTVIFRSNQSGVWAVIGVYNNVTNGTTKHQTVDMINPSTTYWWSVSVTDSGSGNWSNATYRFTTTDKMMKLKWMKTNLPQPNGGGDLLADISGDGIDDVIHTGTGGVVVLDGIDGHTIWSRSDGSITPDVRPEMADLNNDGVFDVIVPLSNGAHVFYGNNGTTYWRINNLRGSAVFSSLIAYDIDGSGYPYVFIPVQDIDEPLDGTLNMISHDGKLLRSTWVYRPCWGGLSLADADFDGRFELYICDRNSDAGKGLRSFWASNLTCRWNRTDIFDSSSIPMIADVNNDGRLDIITPHQVSPYGLLVANFDGTTIKKETGITIPGHYPPSVCDIDRDGHFEILMANPYGEATYDVVVWDLDPVAWGMDARFNVGVCEFGPKCADVDGDGYPEIIAVSSNGIYIYNSTFNRTYQITGLTGRLQYATANDIDGDGLNEVVVPSTAGIVYAFDTFAPTPNPRPRSEVQFYSEYRRGVAEYLDRPGVKYPMQRDEYPANGSSFISPNPTLSAWVWDYQWDEFNITVSTNASGSWQTLASFTHIGRYPGKTLTGNAWGRYSVPTTTMTQPYATYYWRIFAVDVKGNSFQKTYRFTTADVAPTVSNPNPAEGKTGLPLSLSTLRFTLMDFQGDKMNYTVQTRPNIGSGQGTNVGNGNYSVSVGGLSYNTTYTWFVNVTDGNGHWTNKTYPFTSRPSPGVWWNPGWMYRKELILNNTKIAGLLSNFPILISLGADANLIAHAQPDGDDLVVTDYNRHPLNHEIELYNATTGKLVIWVNVTSLSPTSTIILYMYYGNPSCASQQHPTGVWHSSYLAVHHLEETNGTVFDSTIRHRDGTPLGGLQQIAIGIIDGADTFDGTNDYIDLGTTTDFNKQDLTVSAWVKSSVPTTDMRIVVGGASYTYKWHLIMDDGYFMMTNNTLATTN